MIDITRQGVAETESMSRLQRQTQPGTFRHWSLTEAGCRWQGAKGRLGSRLQGQETAFCSGCRGSRRKVEILRDGFPLHAGLSACSLSDQEGDVVGNGKWYQEESSFLPPEVGSSAPDEQRGSVRPALGSLTQP